MNQASSRSHCVFAVDVEARRPGSSVVRRARLNLVDLAGSERVGRTGSEGSVLREARHINLSLHYLEQVIIALQDRGEGGRPPPHVPYRNSLMTMVLRDSLGGNCRTVMVATVTAAAEHVDESISTCRFAQRVARVTNEPSVNEEADPAAVIRRLKQEASRGGGAFGAFSLPCCDGLALGIALWWATNSKANQQTSRKFNQTKQNLAPPRPKKKQVRDLKDEISMLRGGGPARGPLTPDEVARLRERVEAFCGAAPSGDAGAAGAALTAGGDVMAIRACEPGGGGRQRGCWEGG